jgi:hypothetical protein
MKPSSKLAALLVLAQHVQHGRDFLFFSQLILEFDTGPPLTAGWESLASNGRQG